MIQKIYHMKNLECANCAAKMEAKFNELPEVESASIIFATRQLRLTAEEPDALVEKLTAIARTVEPEVEILTHDDCDHSHDHCGCDHHQEEKCRIPVQNRDPRSSRRHIQSIPSHFPQALPL